MTREQDFLEAAGLDSDGAAAVALRPAPASPALVDRICRVEFLRCTSSGGESVVFLAGESLPDWALEVQEAKHRRPALRGLPEPGKRAVTRT